MFTRFRRWLDRVGETDRLLKEVDRAAEDVQHEHRKLTDSIEGVISRSKEEGSDPLRLFVHQIRNARFRQSIKKAGG